MLFLLQFSFFSCTSEGNDGQLNSEDYLIFGIFYGECFGDCWVSYKLQNGMLYPDDTEFPTFEEIPFKKDPLDHSKFEIAKVLIESFPLDLLQSDKRTYGCPDCGDQGGYYLELMEDGKREVWTIDTEDVDQNQAIIDYKEKIFDILQQL